MNKITKKTAINIIVMFAMTGLFIYLLVIVWNTMHSAIAISLSSLAVLILIAGVINKLRGGDTVYKLAIISIYVGVIMIIIYDILIFSGFLYRFENYNELKLFIQSSGGKAEIIFVLAQFLQVTFIPIPSNIVVMIGDELFGSGKAFYLSFIGIMIGSLFAFFLGKTFGLRLATWIAGKEAIEKYQAIVKGRDKVLLALMFIFPVFPDDLLCLIAGLTTMSYPTFIIIMLIARPLSIGGTILFKKGSFDFIPLSGWGIPIWILLIGVMVAIFVYSTKNGDKIEMFMLKFMGRMTGRNYIKEMYPDEVYEDEEVEPINNKDKTIVDNSVIVKDIKIECRLKAVNDKEYKKE